MENRTLLPLGCGGGPVGQHAPTYLRAGARMKAGVVGSKWEVGTRTEQCLELESTGARTFKNPQRESIRVSGRSRVFSELVL